MTTPDDPGLVDLVLDTLGDARYLWAAELTDSGDRSETAVFILHISGLRDFFAGQSERATSQLDEAERR